MTPLYLQLLMPVAQVIGAALIVSRISWRNHPALIAWLLSEAFFEGMAAAGTSYPQWSIAMKIGIVTAVVFEVLKFSRVCPPTEQRGMAAGIALSVSAVLAALPGDLTATQRSYLFRGDYLLLLAGVVGWVAVLRWRRPVLECRRHRAYRIGAALWLAERAISGAFVKGGLGYMVLPYTRRTWEAVNYATYGALIATVLGMSVAMRLSVAPRKRAVAALAMRKAA